MHVRPDSTDGPWSNSNLLCEILIMYENVQKSLLQINSCGYTEHRLSTAGLSGSMKQQLAQ